MYECAISVGYGWGLAGGARNRTECLNKTLDLLIQHAHVNLSDSFYGIAKGVALYRTNNREILRGISSLSVPLDKRNSKKFMLGIKCLWRVSYLDEKIYRAQSTVTGMCLLLLMLFLPVAAIYQWGMFSEAWRHASTEGKEKALLWRLTLPPSARGERGSKLSLRVKIYRWSRLEGTKRRKRSGGITNMLNFTKLNEASQPVLTADAISFRAECHPSAALLKAVVQC